MKKILIGIIFLTILGISKSSLAATTAEQVITGTLGPFRDVKTDGGNLSASILANSGSLNTFINPSFKIRTNTSASQNLDLIANCVCSDGSANGFSDKGFPAGVKYIALAHESILPSVANVANALSPSPSIALNPNVIVYPVTGPVDTVGQLVFTWQAGTQKYTGNLTHKGETPTQLVIPAGVVASGTFGINDSDGVYLTAVTLAFNPI